MIIPCESAWTHDNGARRQLDTVVRAPAGGNDFTIRDRSPSIWERLWTGEGAAGSSNEVRDWVQAREELVRELVADQDRRHEERKRDAELAAEIVQRKKTTNERSIKLTVVLMASRRMLGERTIRPIFVAIVLTLSTVLDDPALDARLMFIRRQGGLDPRAALFVLSPVTQTEIGDFVRR